MDSRHGVIKGTPATTGALRAKLAERTVAAAAGPVVGAGDMDRLSPEGAPENKSDADMPPLEAAADLGVRLVPMVRIVFRAPDGRAIAHADVPARMFEGDMPKEFEMRVTSIGVAGIIVDLLFGDWSALADGLEDELDRAGREAVGVVLGCPHISPFEKAARGAVAALGNAGGRFAREATRRALLRELDDVAWRAQ